MLSLALTLSSLIIPLPQPLTQLDSPSWSILIHSEFLRHRFASIRKRWSRALAFNLGQRRKIAAYSEDNGAGSWKASQCMVFDTEERGGRVEGVVLGGAVGGFDRVGAFIGEMESVLVALNRPLCVLVRLPISIRKGVG